MASSQDYINGVNEIFSEEYIISQGTAVPAVTDLLMGNSGRELELTMLFIDIDQSTKIVDGLGKKTAARMYKSFLWGITKIARANGGKVRSFNGDGMLVVFSSDAKNSQAAKAALQMSWFMINTIKPKMEAFFKNNSKLSDMEFSFGIGIDTGNILIIRGGIRGEQNNDLVWSGNATNYAVKLAGQHSSTYHIHISDAVYKKLNKESKFSADGKNMWGSVLWLKNMKTIYRSSWKWKP